MKTYCTCPMKLGDNCPNCNAKAVPEDSGSSDCSADVDFIEDVLKLLESCCPSDLEPACDMLKDWRAELLSKQNDPEHLPR